MRLNTGAFYGVGELTGAHASAAKPEFFLSAEHVRQVAGHAVLGCTQAVMAGGNCRSGALSAAIPAAAGPKLPGEVGTLTNMLGRAVVGAIASRLGGGRAELGAFQAVFAYLTNDMATEMSVDGSTITVEVGNYPQSANEWFVGFAKFSDPIFGVSSIAVCAAEGCSAGGWTLALAAVTPVGRAGKGVAAAHSVAFEATIAKAGVGKRGSHYTDANKSLAAAMNKDPAFAKMMDGLGVKIPQRLDQSPAGWSWHHVPNQPGTLQLVPRAQHQGGPWQPLLHPNQTGGFKLWGADY